MVRQVPNNGQVGCDIFSAQLALAAHIGISELLTVAPENSAMINHSSFVDPTTVDQPAIPSIRSLQNGDPSMSKLLTATTIAMFTMLAPASAAFDPKCIVTAVDFVAQTFSCHAKPGGPIYTYKTTSKTKIRINGKRVRLSYLWDAGSFSEIKVREIITVRYHLDHGNRITDRVAIYPKK
jgi:hypothetical protein